MKILHIVYNRVGQGSYWRAFHFGTHLARRGHHVTVMATSPQRRLKHQVSSVNGITLFEAPDMLSGSLRSGWDPWNTLNRILWLRKHNFDIVYAIEARPTVIYPSIYLHRIRNMPFVLGWSDWLGRGGSVEERPNPIIRAILRPVETYFEEHFRTEADGSTAICTTLQEKAVQLGINSESIRLIPDGCDLDLFRPLDSGMARNLVKLEQDKFYIGYVGSIFKQDAELMAKAFDHVVELHPTARLLVVGYCPISIGQLSRHPDAIIQTGQVKSDDLFHYLASCDLFWLPLKNSNANRGRWPHKLNDYMALGKATIATEAGDIKALFEHEKIGLISPDQPEPFAQKTLELIRNTSDRIQMGLRARNLAITRFNWEHLTDQLEELYRYSIARHTNHS